MRLYLRLRVAKPHTRKRLPDDKDAALRNRPSRVGGMR
jgi:hypothetical protein